MPWEGAAAKIEQKAGGQRGALGFGWLGSTACCCCLVVPCWHPNAAQNALLCAHVPRLLPVYVLYRRVNVYKDKIKNAGGLPALPQQQALHDALAGTYAELR